MENKYSEQDCTVFRTLIWNNAVNLFEKRKQMSNTSIVKAQKKYINNFNTFHNKNKYKSIDILNNYFKNPNKHIAEQIFWNTVSKKITTDNN